MVVEVVRMQIIWELERTLCWEKGMREFLGMIEIFYILVWVVVT